MLRIKGRMINGAPLNKAIQARPWFSIQAEAGDDVAEVRIFDYIDPWWGIGAEDLAAQLEKITASTIHLHIDSPGGDVFEGITIYNIFRQHPARVEVFIDGLAASIASVIALAGDQVNIAFNAMMMIHNPWTIALGDADEFRKVAEVLDKTTESIAATYRAKTGRPLAELKKLMAEETWLSADEALELGLADAKFGEPDEEAEGAQAKTRFDLSAYKHPPISQQAQEKEPSSGDENRVRLGAVERLRMKMRLALAECEQV